MGDRGFEYDIDEREIVGIITSMKQAFVLFLADIFIKNLCKIKHEGYQGINKLISSN